MEGFQSWRPTSAGYWLVRSQDRDCRLICSGGSEVSVHRILPYETWFFR